jgi:hypothetical protein
MTRRWIVAAFPEPSLLVAVAGPFRSEEKAHEVCDSLARTADAHDELSHASPQVVELSTIAEVRRMIRRGSVL